MISTFASLSFIVVQFVSYLIMVMIFFILLLNICVIPQITRCETQTVAPTAPSQSICASTRPCLNSGRCIDDTEILNGFRCICNGTGFTGETCNVKINSPCRVDSELPCLNDGVCITKQNGFFQCNCKNGFYGDICQFPLDWCKDNQCINGAKCVPQPQEQNYSCTCAPGKRIIV